MADIKVCDRCGKKLTDERTSFTVKPAQSDRVKTSRYILSAKLFKPHRNPWYDPEIVNTEHDLCPECTIELSDWMQSKSKEETDA